MISSFIKIRPKAIFVPLLSSLVLLGCQKVENGGPQTTPKGDFFNYSTTNTYVVNLDYGFDDYLAVFELFENDPMIVSSDGSVVKTDEEPLYRGATDNNGVFNGEITLPDYVKEVYLYSDYIGTVSPVKLPVVDGKISFNQKHMIAGRAGRAFAATTPSNHNYPDSFLVLGDWSNSGKPANITLFDGTIEPGLLYSIRKIYVEPGGAASMNDLYPEYVSNDVNIEVDIKKETSVSLVFLHTTATIQNSIGYFTYETGKKPTDVSQIQHILAYPRISVMNCNSTSADALYSGDKIELKYWDGTAFHDKFPAGVSIGWYIIQSGFDPKDGSVSNKGKNVFYSIRDLNPNGTHRSIAMKKPSSDEIVAIGFEDANAFKNNDKDPKNGNFGDAVFYLEFDEGAIDVGGVPDLPEIDIDKTPLFTTYSGTLSFEDLWPAKGDYDMNDVIVEYSRDIYKNIMTGKVYKLVDTFVPVHSGGSKQNGFGYQLTGLNPAVIKSVKIESDGDVVSDFMQGQTMEPNQNYPTIILYNNNMMMLNKTFKVTIDLTPETLTEKSVTPFLDQRQPSNAQYLFNMNPFIIISTDISRTREAHLTNFPPTSLADMSYFGTLFDISRPEEGLYYVNSDNLPTAMNLSNIRTGNTRGKNFIIPKETVSILQAYPKFESWAKSQGATNSVWWKDPDMSYVNIK